MWRKILAVLLMMSSANAFALGGYGALTEEEKGVADMLVSNLLISEEDAYQLFNTNISSHLKSKDWQYDSFNNESLAGKGDAASSTVRVVHLNFTTDNRFVNITFTKLPAERIIYIQSIETLPRSNSSAMDKYNALQKDADYELKSDRDFFSVFAKKGYTDKVKTLVNSGNGGIQYIDFSFYEIKPARR